MTMDKLNEAPATGDTKKAQRIFKGKCLKCHVDETGAVQKQEKTMATFIEPPKGDAKIGEKIFKTKCSQCHIIDKDATHTQGPNLHGLFGRMSGSSEGFSYSEALKAKNVVWDNDSLYDYLLNPKRYAPGNKMMFVGLKKAQERADVLAYLEQATKP